MKNFGAKRTILDGIVFDSKGEACRYQELKLLQRCGEIRDLELQPRFVLQEAFRRGRRSVPALHYTADFQYVERGRMVVEDFKGHQTEAFRIRMKLFMATHPQYLFRITNAKGGRWDWEPGVNAKPEKPSGKK